MPKDLRLTAQVDLILRSHEQAAAFPGNWEQAGEIDYLFRKGTILCRNLDETRVTEALVEILRDAGGQIPDGRRPFGKPLATGNVLRITVPPIPADDPLPIPEILNRLDAVVGRGTATPDHMLYVCGYPCPATEPIEVPLGTTNPFPPPGFGAPGCPAHHCDLGPGCEGDGVSVSIVDTGLLLNASNDHYWLAGVGGTPDEPYDPAGNIIQYAGHGTFAAGCLRCTAPKASVFVERAFDTAAAAFETDLILRLEDALRVNPDIFVFTFTTSSRDDHSLLTFDDFYERRLSRLKGLIAVVPAGNDGKKRWMWPAAYPWVVSVGALSASWRQRAHFSNYGGWVDVYAPGEDLVNAFATGPYVCNEPPIGQHREFHGMAKWSGTSFSTPIVAGLIAARMSATGENGREAADSLLRFARSQAIPGVGAVLYPGQACCPSGHRDHKEDLGPTRHPCGCHERACVAGVRIHHPV